MATAMIEVTFGAERRPEEATHVRLETFDGPLALLLALIEQQRLDVLTVRLGDLAAAYLEAVTRLDSGRLPLLSSFVRVCSQLILIKSRAMLPRPPVEQAAEADEAGDPEEELRRRLLVYRRYRDAGQQLAARRAAGLALFRREPATASASAQAGASAPSGPALPVALLVEALTDSTRLVPPPPPPAETIKRVVTLEERAAVIRRALSGAPTLVLQELLRDVRDRLVVTVTFLALLELVKAGELSVSQREPWGPIEVRRSGPRAGNVG
jgi:segregation and condensation protein A